MTTAQAMIGTTLPDTLSNDESFYSLVSLGSWSWNDGLFPDYSCSHSAELRLTVKGSTTQPLPKDESTYGLYVSN